MCLRTPSGTHSQSNSYYLRIIPWVSIPLIFLSSACSTNLTLLAIPLPIPSSSSDLTTPPLFLPSSSSSPFDPNFSLIQLSPSSGGPGTLLTLVGTDLNPLALIGITAGGMTVSCVTQTFISPSSIQCVIPPQPSGSSTGPAIITLIQPNLQSASSVFTYNAPPVLGSISPTTGGSGTLLSVTGSQFISGTTINFLSNSSTSTPVITPCTSVTYISSSSLTCITPINAAGVYQVVVTNPDLQTTTSNVTYSYQVLGDQISAGSDHTCAIVNGVAQCWGNNVSQQLGSSSPLSSAAPIVVSSTTYGIQYLASGQNHSCAVVNGMVKCWGDNTYGQLGSNNVPQNGQAVAAGAKHTCAIVSGAVVCWGDNSQGQLGANSVLSGAQFIAAGNLNSCVIVNGAIQCWGDNSFGQISASNFTSSNGAASISIGLNHLCAIIIGSVQCWGDNTYGQVGSTSIFAGAQAVAAGYSHTCAIVNGAISCWGDNTYGQLGASSITSGAQAITAGNHHTCAIVNGKVQCWGDNQYFQLGDHSLVTRIFSLATGFTHSCSGVNGAFECWGLNNKGQLGNDPTTLLQSMVPVQVQTAPSLISGAQAVVAGYSHSCALFDGQVKCWGWNNDGQLGNGGILDSAIPVLAVGNAQKISAGTYHSCALVQGQVQCWGWNVLSQLGNNAGNFSDVPVPVSTGSGFRNIFTLNVVSGSFHSCAIQGGGAWCWGYNGSGQLGDSTTTPRLSPVQVLTSPANIPLAGVQALATGGSHTCALANGGVQCWGDNTYGQLGNGSSISSTVAVPVTGLSSGVQAISAGTNHTCVIWNGTLLCWGLNLYGQLGNNSQLNSPIPVAMLNSGSVTGAQSVSAGAYHTCAMLKGIEYCTGFNAYGQLGNNSTQNSSILIPVKGF